MFGKKFTREGLSKKIGTAVIILVVGVFLIIRIVPDLFGVTLPITKLFPKYGDVRTALIAFALGSCAFVTFPFLLGFQLANLAPKLAKTWSYAILATLLSLSLVSYALIVAFLFYSRQAVEKFHYPIFSETILYFVIAGYPIAVSYFVAFVYEPLVKAVSRVKKFVGYK